MFSRPKHVKKNKQSSLCNCLITRYFVIESTFCLYINDFTVKTLYNVTCYNRIFNIRCKIVGNGSVSIKIPSLQQNIHLMTPTVSSGNRYTFSIKNEFIIMKKL